MELQEENELTTGNTIALRYGIKTTVPELDNWPGNVKFFMAEEAEEIGKQIISLFRDDLRGLNIGYVFKEKASKKGDSVTLGEAKIQNELQKVLHGIDAVVVLGFDAWQTLDLDGKCRLIHHELEHFGVDGETGVVKIIPHPVEEFPSTVKIFGLGQTSHIDFIHAYQEFCKNMGK